MIEWRATGPGENPMPGQVLLYVADLGDYTEDRNDMVTGDLGRANMISSKVVPATVAPVAGLDAHRVVLDIDLPCKLIPSSTPGHHHLYIDAPMSWEVYRQLLEVLAKAGIIEPGYAKASIERGHTCVRLPWIRKDQTPLPGYVEA